MAKRLNVWLGATTGDRHVDRTHTCYHPNHLFLLGGFSGRFGGYGYGFGHGGIGVIGVILIILVVLLLMGRL